MAWGPYLLRHIMRDEAEDAMLASLGALEPFLPGAVSEGCCGRGASAGLAADLASSPATGGCLDFFAMTQAKAPHGKLAVARDTKQRAGASLTYRIRPGRRRGCRQRARDVQWRASEQW